MKPNNQTIGETAAMICAVFVLTGFFSLIYAALTHPPVEVLIIELEPETEQRSVAI